MDSMETQETENIVSKNIVVAGSGRGIGRAIAVALAGPGGTVGTEDLSGEKNEEANSDRKNDNSARQTSLCA